MQKFIDKIINNLTSNGFPEKKVSLPTEKMYEISDSKGLGLNAVLDQLKSQHQIDAEIGHEKIVFSDLGHIGQADMFQKAQEMMGKMSPDEIKKIQELVMTMSADEKDELMNKAKDMRMT